MDHENLRPSISGLFTSMNAQLRRRVSAAMPQTVRGRVGPSDVVQETWISVVRRFSTLKDCGDTDIRRIVYAIASRKLGRNVRRHTQQCRDATQEATLRSDALTHRQGSPSQIAIQRETLDQIVSQLSESDARLLEMHLENASIENICAELRLSPATAYRRINRFVRMMVMATEKGGLHGS